MSNGQLGVYESLEAIDRYGVGYIRLEGARVAALRTNGGGGRFRFGSIYVHKHDPRAFRAQGTCHCETDSRTRSGDDRIPSLQFQGQAFLLIDVDYGRLKSMVEPATGLVK